MKIAEVISEEFDKAEAQANRNHVNLDQIRDIERERKKKKGLDPDLDEILDDFPS